MEVSEFRKDDRRWSEGGSFLRRERLDVGGELEALK